MTLAPKPSDEVASSDASHYSDRQASPQSHQLPPRPEIEAALQTIILGLDGIAATLATMLDTQAAQAIESELQMIREASNDLEEAIQNAASLQLQGIRRQLQQPATEIVNCLARIFGPG